MGRAPCCEKIGLKKGRWTAEEDDTLVKYIATHGEGSWRSLPKNAGLLRCGKSCRLRWINYLRSDLKRGNITPEEEETIIKLHDSLGNRSSGPSLSSLLEGCKWVKMPILDIEPRWSVIAGHLPGRTDNEIKNYWNSHLSRRAHDSEGDPKPVPVDPGKAPSKRKGGRAGKPVRKQNARGEEDRAVHEKSGESEEGESMVTDIDSGPQQASSAATLENNNGEAEGVGPWGGGEDSTGATSMGRGEGGARAVNVGGGEGGTGVVKEGEGGGEKAEALNEEGTAGCEGDVKWVEWEMGEMESKLWDGIGEMSMWPWSWDGSNDKGTGAGGGEYQLEGTLDSWLSEVL